MTTTLHLGDSREILASLEPCSIDAVVTDPPYEIDFMGSITKGWDKSGVAFDPEFWALCLRALKPGGHLVSAGACRTYHRIAVGIEDAGFQIRDCIQWLFGSGFPKSLDAPRAIEKELAKKLAKKLEAEREFTAWMRTTGVTPSQINEATGTSMGSHYLTAASQPAIPTAELLDRMRHILPPVPEWIEKTIAEREQAKAESRKRNANPHFMETLHRGNTSAVAEREEALAWKGWGTALKPAYEPFILARKALDGNVARTLLRHGTGGLNIDACRVDVSESDRAAIAGRQWVATNLDRAAYGAFEADGGTREIGYHDGGRWPPNVAISPEVARKLGDQAAYFPVFDYGDLDLVNPDGTPSDALLEIAEQERVAEALENGDRFFYAAKASRSEREAGCEHLPTRSAGEATGRKEGSAGINNPRAGAGRTSAADIHNYHPTVKPVSLMRWLCRLVTPPGGVILDPFAGSGTTGIAAISEGFGFIGVEMDPDHHAIAMARLEHASSMPVETNRDDYAPPQKRQLGLFM